MGKCSICDEPDHNARKCPLNDAPAEVRITNSRSQRAAMWLAEQPEGTFYAAGNAFSVSHQSVQQAWARLYGNREPPSAIAKRARDAKITELAGKGLSRLMIAAELGVSREVVHSVAVRLGLTLERHTRWFGIRERSAAAAAAVQAGATVVDAAIDHGVSRGRLDRTLREMGVRPQMSRARDGRTARALARVDKGESVSEACRAERCAAQSVYTMRKRRQRKPTTE